MDPPVWFYWPISFAVAAGYAAARVSRIARDVGGRTGSAGLVAPLLLATAIPVIPLTFAMGERCSDDSHVLTANIPLLGAGFLGLVAWLAIVARLYRTAGDDSAKAERRIVVMLCALLLGMAVEFIYSALSLSAFCTGSSTGMYSQLFVAAVISAAVAGTVWARGMKTNAGRF